jgi:TonB family protein
MPEAQVRLGAVLPAAMRERLKKMHLLEQFSGISELPIDEILGSVFEVGQVLIEVHVDRHVTVNLGLGMDTTLSASVFYVLGNTLLLPALELLEEKPFVSDPVLNLDGLQLVLRFALDGDMLLKRFEASLNEDASAVKPGAQDQGQIEEDVEQDAIQAYLGLVFQKLESHMRYPEVAKVSGLSGRVVLRFTVHRDGEVFNPEITDVTGHDAFGDDALRALKQVGQLPPFPEQIGRRELLVEVPLTYRTK